MTTNSAAQAWIRTVAGNHLPKTARSYQWVALGGNAAGSPARLLDAPAFEGKVVDENESYWLFKKAGNNFHLLGKELCQVELRLGDVCVCTPYSRRAFDGQRHSDPRVEEGPGFRRMIVTMSSRTDLPAPPKPFVTMEMADMVQTIEMERCAEERSIAHILIDAGAMLEPVRYEDSPTQDEIGTHSPTITFRVKTQKVDGYLSVYYRRIPDCYGVRLRDLQGTELAHEDCIFAACDGPSSLAEKIIDLVDDGAWRFAQFHFIRRGKQVSTSATASPL